MADSLYNHYHPPATANAHPHHPLPPPPPPNTSHTSRKSAIFNRLAQPFTASRPQSSSGYTHSTPTAYHGSEKPPLGPPPTSAPKTVLTSAPNLLNSRTVRYNLESPLLALSVNPGSDRVVVAGREMLRILRVGYNEVAESSNLRVPGEHRKQFQHDVKWGTLNQESMIATAGTNGSIFLYDVKKGGQLDGQLRDHGRQVHKIAFNPADGNLLLSASQDGTVKLWDLRERKARVTFMGKAEAVRDVEFNAQNAVEFVAGYDNGSVQRWDYRNPSHCLRRINGHNGPVFSVAWHPDGKHCASGGRDRKVQVWDFYDESRIQHPKHTISTTAAIHRIAWRPGSRSSPINTTEIASCAVNNDHRVHVWDLKRPFVPTRIIDQHDNCTTGILWKDEDILWSCSKDGTFVQNDANHASQPLNSLPHTAFAWGLGDEFTFATQRRGKAPGRVRSGASLALSSSRGTLDTTEEDLSMLDKRRHGRTSSFKSLKPTVSERSVLDGPLDKYVLGQSAARVAIRALSDTEAFLFFAKQYIIDLHGVSGTKQHTLSEACEWNAKLAWRAQKYRTAQTWRVIALAAEAEDAALERLARRAPVTGESMVSTQRASGLVARRALGRSGEMTPHGAHRSGGTTPMAAASDSPVSAATPIPRKAQQTLEENLLSLPPAAFGTSVSSSGSTDGGDGDSSLSHSHNSNHSNVSDIGTEAVRRPSLALITSPSESVKTTVHAPEHKPTDPSDPHPSASTESVPQADKEPDSPPSIDSDNHREMFTATSERSNPLEPELAAATAAATLIPTPSGSSTAHPRPPEQASSGSATGTTFSTFSRKYSLISDQTSSSYQRSTDDDDGYGGSDASHPGASLPLDAIPEEMLMSGILKRPILHHAPTSSVPELRVDSPATTVVRPLLATITRPAHASTEEEVGLAARPWGLQRLADALIEHYADRGDVQFLSALALLLQHRITLPPIRAQDWTEGYISLLKRHRLFERAAEVVKAAPDGWGMREGAQWGVWVDSACPRCGRLLRGGGGCTECRAAVAVCGMCESRVKGRWTMCQTCEHGGHESCIRAWYVGNGEVCGTRECFKEGCGCVCLPR